ncbi:hypothetical protein GH714_005245 [Hevea brasiliensis]|uniref:Uncharacterized protein n=1 Tax=Hevea brasiliensis TaxID=3981 RepID=A0A6A6KJL0_HEVBR|nr:hypothetical protein GH714_005245 [Hevea brasiliensis]
MLSCFIVHDDAELQILKLLVPVHPVVSKFAHVELHLLINIPDWTRRQPFCCQKKIANTGALCCVATGPQRVKSPTGGRDSSNNHNEPHWRTNSSFSSPPLRMWDCRLRSDVLPHGSHGVHGSSLSSNSRGSRNWVGSDPLTNHHHSVSDGVLFYSDSLPDNVKEPRWTSPVQKFNLGEVAVSTVGGSRFQTSWFPSTERPFPVRANAASPSFGSPSSQSESSHWESTSKRPFAFSNCNFPSRHSYMSKTVYPLVFRNPVSECETFSDADISSIGRLIPDPSASSRREGFRWSSASSYDLGLDGDRFDVAEDTDIENLRSPNSAVPDQKCGICKKFLWQKSPWSSHRIMRGGDMPITGCYPAVMCFMQNA